MRIKFGYRALFVLLLVDVILVAAFVGLYILAKGQLQPILPSADQPKNGAMVYSGTLEAREMRIASEVSARVTQVGVAKGDKVRVGDRLLSLEDSGIQSSLTEADAGVRAAQANLDQVREMARPGQIAIAEASVKQANADYDAAQVAWADAKRGLETPQEILSQVHIWEGRVAAAQGQLAQSQALLAGTKSELESAINDQSMAGKYRVESLRSQQVAGEKGVQAAQAELDGSRRVLDQYRLLRDNPLEIQAALRKAADQVKVAEAGRAVAQAELALVRRAAQPEAVAQAQARLAGAQSTYNLVQAQARRYVLTSPTNGTIVGRDIDPGETARPGVALLTVADTRELQITVYVPVRDMEKIRVGQEVRIRIPSLEGRTYTGHLSYLSPEAEFKPANIYNSQERSEIVFAVRAVMANSGEELKAGLPADVLVE